MADMSVGVVDAFSMLLHMFASKQSGDLERGNH